MIDQALLSGPATNRDLRPFHRRTPHVSLPVSQETHPWALSPEQDAFLRDRFSTTLEDPDTGRRIK